MIDDLDIVKITLKKKYDKEQLFSFTVHAFDVGDFFDMFLNYFDNYDSIIIDFSKEKKGGK